MTTNQNPSLRLATSIAPVRIILLIEGAAIALTCAALYGQIGGSWLLFAALLLVPDVAMLGYLAGPRIGAMVYNLAHSYAMPLALAGVALRTDSQITLMLALIWGAHIGMDRALGYGLKYPSGFKDTHLSKV